MFRRTASTLVVTCGAVLALAATAAAQTQPLFEEATSYPIGSAPMGSGFGDTGLAHGDFNRDGVRDLAVVNSSNVAVLRGNGSGYDAPAAYPADTGASAVTVGDFDGVAGPDLAVAAFAGTVTVLLNKGDGTFRPGGSYSTPLSTFDVAAGDLTGDARPDLVVVSPLSTAPIVLRNLGDGRFTKSTAPAAGLGASSVELGDFNGDGVLDAAVALNASVSVIPVSLLAKVQLLLGRGDGTFTLGGSSQVTGFIEGLGLGDVNADGRADVLAANAFPGSVVTLLGTGNGRLAAVDPLSVSGFPVDVAVGDFDGDARADVVVADDEDSTLHVYAGDGFGGYAHREDHAVGFQPQSLITTDLDGDGLLDIAASGASNNVSVLNHTAG